MYGRLSSSPAPLERSSEGGERNGKLRGERELERVFVQFSSSASKRLNRPTQGVVFIVGVFYPLSMNVFGSWFAGFFKTN